MENKVSTMFPIIMQVKNKAGDVLVTIDSNGTVDLKMPGINKMVAEVFWNGIRDKIIHEKEINLQRDLQFIITFMQGKGIWFSNPNEKIEFMAWVGEIQRRYGLK